MRESLKKAQVDPRPGQSDNDGPAIRESPGLAPSGHPGSRPVETPSAVATYERSRFERAIATWEGEGGSLIEAAS